MEIQALIITTREKMKRKMKRKIRRKISKGSMRKRLNESPYK